MSDPLDGYFDDDDAIPCPRCDGGGTVDCHCGGDLCVCTNYGEAPCPVCHGDGSVTEEREAEYFAAKRKFQQVLSTALSKANGESGDV